MNTFEYVKLTDDTNYIPVKYATMEATIGSTAATSYVWLKCVGLGVATKADFDALKTSIDEFKTPNKALMIGNISEYIVKSVSLLSAYKSPAHFSDAGLLLG